MIVNQNHERVVLIAAAGLSLLVGLGAGLVRLGGILPLPNDQFPFVHGPLMVVGFLGTLIGLERAVALGRVRPFGVPILTALSIVGVVKTRCAIVSVQE